MAETKTSTKAAGNKEKGKDAPSIFRQQAMSHITNADDLDHYIKVTNPSGWAILIAAVLFMGGLFIWGSTSIIPVNQTFTGMIENDVITCWVDEESYNLIKRGGAYAKVNSYPIADVEIATGLPLSEYELKNFLGSDYLADSVPVYKWNYLIYLKMPDELADNVPQGRQSLVPVDFTLSMTNPIALIMRKG